MVQIARQQSINCTKGVRSLSLTGSPVERSPVSLQVPRWSSLSLGYSGPSGLVQGEDHWALVGTMAGPLGSARQWEITLVDGTTEEWR